MVLSCRGNGFVCTQSGWLRDVESSRIMKALDDAWSRRGKPEDVMLHSDQSCQYTSLTFRQRIWRYRLFQSMSRRWDNAPMERLFRSLKTE